MTEQQQFKIFVRAEQYSVEVHQDDYLRKINYRISTGRNYLMTVYKNEQGSWSADGEVQLMDDDLVNDIGSAIEMHNAGAG